MGSKNRKNGVLAGAAGRRPPVREILKPEKTRFGTLFYHFANALKMDRMRRRNFFHFLKKFVPTRPLFVRDTKNRGAGPLSNVWSG